MTRQERDVPAFPFEFGPYGSSTRAYDILRRSSPLRRVSLPSGQQAWLVTTYADVCSVHREPMFSRAEAVRTAVFGIHYGHEHVPRWTHTIHTEAHRVIDGLEKGRIFDLRANLFEPIARRCAESLFGFPVATNNLQLDRTGFRRL